jgi:hypothetical protein
MKSLIVDTIIADEKANSELLKGLISLKRDISMRLMKIIKDEKKIRNVFRLFSEYCITILSDHRNGKYDVQMVKTKNISFANKSFQFGSFYARLCGCFAFLCKMKGFWNIHKLKTTTKVLWACLEKCTNQMEWGDVCLVKRMVMVECTRETGWRAEGRGTG